MNLYESYAVGLPLGQFLDKYGTHSHRQRWQATRNSLALSESMRQTLQAFKREMHVLVLAGAWCGDCSSQCPWFELFADVAPCLKIRYCDRDEQTLLQQVLRINGGNRVPVVVFFSEDGHEVSRFGERTLAQYRHLLRAFSGEGCSTGIVLKDDPLQLQIGLEWLNEFERVHAILRLSPRLRSLHKD